MSARSLNLFDLAVGNTLLDRYEILRPHRQSGMSAAFEVRDVQSDESLELQAFPASLFEDKEQASEFGERLLPWKHLKNPSVLRLCDVEVMDDGAVILGHDFPEGVSLRSYFEEQGRMGPQHVVRLGIDLLAGLMDIHGAGLVHGDVKPSTIHFLESEDHGQLLDGGITPGMWAAKHMGTRTALIGTPYYAPLEQFTGDAPDALGDLYAVATVLYELLCGELPWSGRTFVEVFQSKMQKEPPAMAFRAPGVEIDPELEAVIARGLHAERRNRFPNAESFQAELSRFDGS